MRSHEPMVWGGNSVELGLKWSQAELPAGSLALHNALLSRYFLQARTWAKGVDEVAHELLILYSKG